MISRDGANMIDMKYDIHIFRKEDKLFPTRLNILEDCPDILYVLGNAGILNDFAIAIVGSRSCDEYGKSVTEDFSRELAQSGVCVISGLAEGIDTYAHKGALAGNGKTIAVLGSGFAHIFPASNKQLLEEIIESGGAIVSEYLPDQVPMSMCFPRRNRIVAAMTEGTLVTQAREKSGALITAKLARHYGKKLFAVPGDLNNRKRAGSNSLFKMGAKMVVEEKDILNEFPDYHFSAVKKSKKKTSNRLPPEKYANTYLLLQNGPIHMSELCRISKQ